MSIFFAHPFILGIALAWVWDKIKGSISSDPKKFALGVFAIATIPGMVITYSSFQLSLAIVLSWTIMGLVNAYVAGLILAKMNG